MLPYFTDQFGNAASKTHAYGWIAEEAVKLARAQVAQVIQAEQEEIIFTSGATEGINLALKGIHEAYRTKGNHIVTLATEHKAVLDACRHLEKSGAQVTVLPVKKDGLLDLDLLEQSIRPDTVAIAIMLVNNETGVIQPVHEIAEIVHSHSSLFVCDATQGFGKIPIDVQQTGVDVMCMSAHKLYGPKGTGAVYVRRKNPRVTLAPLMDGGGHEKGLRSGTLNVPGIAGFGKACEIAMDEMEVDAERIRLHRDHLEKVLIDSGNVSVNGSISSRLYNVTNLAFAGISANELIASLKEVAVATGSACTSAIPEPSHVLKAMQVPDELAYASIRFSLGKFTTEDEIEFAIKKTKEVWSFLKGQ